VHRVGYYTHNINLSSRLFCEQVTVLLLPHPLFKHGYGWENGELSFVICGAYLRDERPESKTNSSHLDCVEVNE
jgi:hypothetical protein